MRLRLMLVIFIVVLGDYGVVETRRLQSMTPTKVSSIENMCSAIEDSLRKHLLLVSMQTDSSLTHYVSDYDVSFRKYGPATYYGQLHTWMLENEDDIRECLLKHMSDADSAQLVFSIRSEYQIMSTYPMIAFVTVGQMRQRYYLLLQHTSKTLNDCRQILKVRSVW